MFLSPFLQIFFESWSMTNSFLISLVSNKFFIYMFSFNMFAYIHIIIIIFLQIEILLFIQETKEKEKRLCEEDPRNLAARDRGLSDYYSESSILESRVHGDESPILLTLTILDRRAKWLQRIPFSRSTVVTFGGPKFLTLQITSTRKRKSAVYFVCWQSRTSPSPLIVRVRCWWSAVERFIEPFLPYPSPPPPSH